MTSYKLTILETDDFRLVQRLIEQGRVDTTVDKRSEVIQDERKRDRKRTAPQGGQDRPITVGQAGVQVGSPATQDVENAEKPKAEEVLTV